jgi:transcriptional regulator with XRE-family HTH domain
METGDAARKIREELARQRMSRARLADRAKISLSALEKCLTGKRKFTEATLTRIGDVLGLALADHASATAAADELGGYARATVSWLDAPPTL